MDIVKLANTYALGAGINARVTAQKVDEIIDVVNALNNSADNNGTVTQLTAITTPVTLDAWQGVITTVSSTLAGNSNTVFTVNNVNVKAGSVITLTCENLGAGIAVLNVESVTDGSFAVRIYNVSASAFNNKLKIYFTVS